MSAQSPTVATACASIRFAELEELLHQVFVRHGTSAQVAAILAHNCASAERDGAHSHGIFRIPVTFRRWPVDGSTAPPSPA